VKDEVKDIPMIDYQCFEEKGESTLLGEKSGEGSKVKG
jgi:hypothetical protein